MLVQQLNTYIIFIVFKSRETSTFRCEVIIYHFLFQLIFCIAFDGFARLPLRRQVHKVTSMRPWLSLFLKAFFSLHSKAFVTQRKWSEKKRINIVLKILPVDWLRYCHGFYIKQPYICKLMPHYQTWYWWYHYQHDIGDINKHQH